MTIKIIDGDEWYPVYDFATVGFALELTEAEIAQIDAAMTAFNEAQKMITERLEQQGAFRGIVRDAEKWNSRSEPTDSGKA